MRWVLAHRILARHPTLICDPTAIWDYAYDQIDSIIIGRRVSVGAFAEVVVYRHSPYSSVEGRLILGDAAVISTGVNVRAAGGEIRVGAGTAIGQNSILIAANHQIVSAVSYLYSRWNEERCGVEIGDNVWVGASCVLLPGSRIGDNAVIGAGSVVTGTVPAGELWAGVPARRVKVLQKAHDVV